MQDAWSKMVITTANHSFHLSIKEECLQQLTLTNRFLSQTITIIKKSHKLEEIVERCKKAKNDLRNMTTIKLEVLSKSIWLILIICDRIFRLMINLGKVVLRMEVWGQGNQINMLVVSSKAGINTTTTVCWTEISRLETPMLTGSHTQISWTTQIKAEYRTKV